jgi:hypothetical protein
MPSATPIPPTHVCPRVHHTSRTQGADIFIAMGIADPATATALAAAAEHTARVPTRLAFDCAPALAAAAQFGSYRPAAFRGLPPRLSRFRAALPRGGSGADRALASLADTFYGRCTSEDLTFMALSLVDAYVTPVPAAQVRAARAMRVWRRERSAL